MAESTSCITPLDLALWLLPGLTPRRVKELASQLETLQPAPLLEAALHLPRLKQTTRDLVRLALHDPWRLPFAEQITAHLRWAEHPNHQLLPLRSLPFCLQQLPDPPLLLSVRGQAALLEGPSLALVGSRRITPEGKQLAYQWSQQLTWQGLHLISGLAVGVDGQVHRGALQAVSEGAPGHTLAVLGHGMDYLYPREHRGLAEELLALGGALVSDYPLGRPPHPSQFPQRNRIITGLALGVVVIEAEVRSGSLVSARLAMEQGREVMAVPGPPGRQQSEGCHQLIRQGAALVTSPEEVLEEIHQPLSCELQNPASSRSPEALPLDLPPTQQQILSLLGELPLATDNLLQQLGLEARDLLLSLQEMELEGLIEQQPGGWCLSR